MADTAGENLTLNNPSDNTSSAPTEDESPVAALGDSDTQDNIQDNIQGNSENANADAQPIEVPPADTQPSASGESQGTLADNTLDASDDDSTQASGSDATSEQPSLTVTEARTIDSEPVSSNATDTRTIENGQLADVEPPPVNDTTSDTEPASSAALPDSDQESGIADLDPETSALLESPTWILVQDESQFTIQMSASRDLASVQNFLRRHQLPLPNSIFSFERDGEVWYALVHGIFPTLPEARQAVERMPAAAQRDQPWIREVGRVKQIMR